MKKHYVLAICLAAALRLSAQDLPRGNGFGPEQSVLPSGSTSTTTADLDGDGDQDLIVASRSDTNVFPLPPADTIGSVVWYPNDGQNNFGFPQPIGQARADNLHASDLDGDGDQDLLATSGDRIIWYANDGQGNFNRRPSFASGIVGVNTADIDSDGDQDVLSSLYEYGGGGEFVWYPNDGQGNFGEAQLVEGISSGIVTDLNGDGNQDLLVSSFLEPNLKQLVWYANDGQNNFESSQLIGPTEDLEAIQPADLDGDGDQDILLSSYESDATELAWYVNDGQGNFDERRNIDLIPDVNVDGLEVADRDGDGDQDVLFVSGTTIGWYTNDGQGNFGEVELIEEQDGGAEVYAVDLDGDSDVDVVRLTFSEDNIGVYPNDGQGNFTDPLFFEIQAESAEDMQPADLDGDGDQDVLSVSRFDEKIAWYPNDGQGNFSVGRVIDIFTLDDNSEFVEAVDLDGDGDQDVLSILSDKIIQYENDGRGNFGEAQITDTSTNFISDIDLADLDGDGDQDLLSASFDDQDKITWYANDGQGNFNSDESVVVNPQVTGNLRAVRAADLDGDGDQDILSASFDELTWYANDGQGSFGEPQTIAADGSGLVYAADLDGDGDQDVLSVSSGNIVRYENDGQGTFEQKQEIPNERLQTLYAADLDGDGDQDILSGSGNDRSGGRGGVDWYVNDGNGNLSAPLSVLSSSASGAQPVYAVDLNGDGSQDVLANFRFDEIVWSRNELPQSSSAPRILALTLLNARTDTEVQPISDGLVLDLLSPEPDLRDYNVAAEVEVRGQTITRVVFELDAPDDAGQDTTRAEQKAPYVLFGHLGKDYREAQAYAGDYTLTATPYYQDSTGAEVVGVGQTVRFTFVTPNLGVRNLRLVDTRSGEVIKNLTPSFEVVRIASDQPVSVLADTRFSQFNSVEFFLDGPGPDGRTDVQALENLVPYSLFGDGGLNTAPNGQPLAEGEYELRVIAYQGKNRDGYAGPETVISLDVIHEASESESLAYPVPFTSEVNLRTKPVDLNNVRVRFVHSFGQVYDVSPDQVTPTEEGLRINVANLPAGPYTIQLQQADQVQTFRGSKK